MIFLIIFVVIIGALTLAYSIYLLDTAAGKDLPTTNKALDEIVKIISDVAPETSQFVDFGSGKGQFGVRLAQKLKKPVLGYEKNSVRVFFSNLRAKLFGANAKFINKNFLKEKIELSPDTVLYTYIAWHLMPILENLLKSQGFKGYLITNTSRLPNIQPIKKIQVHPEDLYFEVLHIYKF